MRSLHLVATLLVAAVALSAAPARAEIKTQWIDYTQGGTPLRGYLAYDDAIKGPRPGVLLVHRRDGMGGAPVKEHAEMVARLGYVVFAPGLFGVLPNGVEEEKGAVRQYNADRPLRIAH